MSVAFHVVIPARYQSSRLPGKLLMNLRGMPIIEHVYRRALLAAPQSIMIATDSEHIVDWASGIGAPVMLTSSEHQSGTDRIAEVAMRCGFSPDEIVVNVQGDEPFIASELICQVASDLAKSDAPMATLCWPIDELEVALSSHVVKVVRDASHHAMYFSRSLIPAHRDDPTQLNHVFRHIGLYAYRAAFLLKVVKQPVCELEALEALEQLRVLWLGYRIRVEEACVKPLQDINTLDDLLEARRFLETK